MPHLAVFASSSQGLPAELLEQIDRLTFALARSGWDLVYGGANVGLMNVTASAFRRAGREVVSVIPSIFDRRGLTFGDSTTVIRTDDLRERKRIMAEQAAAFLALPGGPGTADEFIEILTAKLVGMSEAPLVLYDPGGQWRHLIALLEDMERNGFAYREPRSRFVHARSIEAVLDALPVAGRDGSL